MHEASVRSHRRHIWISSALIAAGVALLVIPASGEGQVLVPISEGHGLSAIDAAGAVLLTLGGVWLEVTLMRQLPQFALSPRILFGLGLLGGTGIGLLVASAFAGFYWWWAVGAAMLAVVLAVLVGRAMRRS